MKALTVFGLLWFAVLGSPATAQSCGPDLGQPFYSSLDPATEVVDRSIASFGVDTGIFAAQAGLLDRLDRVFIRHLAKSFRVLDLPATMRSGAPRDLVTLVHRADTLEIKNRRGTSLLTWAYRDGVGEPKAGDAFTDLPRREDASLRIHSLELAIPALVDFIILAHPEYRADIQLELSARRTYYEAARSHYNARAAAAGEDWFINRNLQPYSRR